MRLKASLRIQYSELNIALNPPSLPFYNKIRALFVRRLPVVAECIQILDLQRLGPDDADDSPLEEERRLPLSGVAVPTDDTDDAHARRRTSFSYPSLLAQTAKK